MSHVIAFVVGAFLMACVAAPTIHNQDKDIQSLEWQLDRSLDELNHVCNSFTVDELDARDLTECQ
jgi:hypothetical protein